MLSRLIRKGQVSPRRARVTRSLELIFYRGEAKTAMLRRVFGLESVDAMWVGLYFHGSPHEVLSVDRELLDVLTPPYSSISFALPTSDPGEHRDAMSSLDLAGIRYNETISAESALAGTQSPSGKVFKLSGATLNREIYRLVFEVMYDTPTLVSHRFIFTISPPLLNLEVNSSDSGNVTANAHGNILVSTYYWRGLQLVSRELREESVERLAGKVAEGHNASLLVRNR